MEKEEKGFIYILTNPSFREDWIKIGKSSKPVNVRSKELDNTAIPLPFEIYATMETSMYHKAERFLHRQIDKLTTLRIRKSREFFNIPPEKALSIFEDFADLFSDAVIVRYENNQPIPPKTPPVAPPKRPPHQDEPIIKEKQPPRSRFRFSMIGLKVGQTIEFVPTGTKVKVASDNQVSYNGQLYTLSRLTAILMPEEQRCSSGAYQGPKYFAYQGRTLNAMRLALEKEDGESLT